MKIVKSGENKSFDGYFAADIATVITLILFVVFVIKKTSPKYWALCGSITLFLVAVQTKFGKTQLRNVSTNDVTVKDESSSETAGLYSGETAIDIDGANVNGIVYKIPDGVHATIKDGIVKVEKSFFLGPLIYSVRGGKKQLRRTMPGGPCSNVKTLIFTIFQYLITGDAGHRLQLRTAAVPVAASLPGPYQDGDCN